MSRTLASVKEWLLPESVRRQTVPPFDGGLRPNDDLDHAWTLVQFSDEEEPDDLLLLADGRLILSMGSKLLQLERSPGQVVPQRAEPTVIAQLPGRVSAMAADGAARIVAAVEGQGLVTVEQDGSVAPLCREGNVRSGVTDLMVEDGTVLLTVGSNRHSSEEWGQALIAGDASGMLVMVRSGVATVVADRLSWPAGICRYGDDVAVSMSLANRVELWGVGTRSARRKNDLLPRLAVYPGRIRRSRQGWWLAAPYARNRLTELLLDEPKLLRQLERDVDARDWPLPRLRPENIYRDPMQLGQLRVLGVVKPWAPPRSYGLVLHVDGQGLITHSHHSRIAGDCHGVTGIAVTTDGSLVLVARGARRVVALDQSTSAREEQS